MAKNSPKFTLEGAELLFKNFSGHPSQYNEKGNRHFSVILPQDLAEDLLADGWNVKFLKAHEEGDTEPPYVEVTVSYKNRPPRIVMITGEGEDEVRTTLNDDSVETLDFVSMRTVDLTVNGYVWEVNGKGGIKAYVQTMYVTIEEDELDRKYAQRPSGAFTEEDGSEFDD